MHPYYLAILFLLLSACSGCRGGSVGNNRGVVATVYSPEQFYSLPRFEGELIKYDILGSPLKRHDNSGPILNLYIMSDNGMMLVTGFPASKTATTSLDSITNVVIDDYPDRINNIRDSILTD